MLLVQRAAWVDTNMRTLKKNALQDRQVLHDLSRLPLHLRNSPQPIIARLISWLFYNTAKHFLKVHFGI